MFQSLFKNKNFESSPGKTFTRTLLKKITVLREFGEALNSSHHPTDLLLCLA